MKIFLGISKIALAFTLLISYTYGNIKVINPRPLVDYFQTIYNSSSIPSVLAYFGLPPYGRSIIGQIENADDPYGCRHTLINTTSHEEPVPKFIIFDIGECSNTLKVKYAQDIGINCVILINTDDSDLEKINIYDDGIGYEIQIPTVIVNNRDGNKLRQAALETKTEISIEFEMKRTYSIVQLDVWMSSDNLKVFDFLSDLHDMIHKIDFELVKFRPGFVHWQCTECKAENYTKSRADCLSGGRYCAVDPDNLGPISGRFVVEEDLREICLYSVVSTSKQYDLWFKYIKDYHKLCRSSFSNDCSKDLMNNLGLDYNQVQNCLRTSTEGNSIYINDNTLLRNERNRWKQSGIQFYPAIVINNQTYRGNWESEEVCEAICASFENMPKACINMEHNQNNEDIASIGSVVGILLGMIALFAIALAAYRYKVKQEMKKNMRREINVQVSQYFSLQEKY
ncbi:unnamed protein product [Blepharisma stoltei]|uniref:Vacuolar sorting receptor thioredoxin-like domain-containing protein n=1 Tax=Blepharisma stoltei TaxID=1481888 RepID=A0AAU9JFW9_9CILI|nr:unnamed protein product [Blepharisma stoltei]